MYLKSNLFKFFSYALNRIISLFGNSLASKIKSRLAEELIPIIDIKTSKGNLSFYCPGYLPLYRAETLLTKEPETIEWINGFEDNSVFWDIGANIGVYSLYAALNETTQVFAFEPAGINYHILNENIKLNQIDNRISAICIAFNEQVRIDNLYMSDTRVGAAHSSFGKAIDQFGEPLNFQFKQAMIGFSIDDFLSLFDLPFPNYIKIDVDGIEDKILAGAVKTLNNKYLKSLLVELDGRRTNHYKKTVHFIESCGLRLTKKHLIAYTKNGKLEMYNNIFWRI